MNSSKKDCKLKKRRNNIRNKNGLGKGQYRKDEEKRVLNDLKETEIYTKKNLSTMKLCGKNMKINAWIYS